MINFMETQNSRKIIEMKYLGTSVEAIVDSQNRCVIRRVLSTDPETFLNPRLAPGSPVDI